MRFEKFDMRAQQYCPIASIDTWMIGRMLNGDIYLRWRDYDGRPWRLTFCGIREVWSLIRHLSRTATPVVMHPNDLGLGFPKRKYYWPVQRCDMKGDRNGSQRL